MKAARLGCVKYLNARPLIRGWPVPVTFDHPSALCAQLARGDLDIALVSSFELLRNPLYRVVDGLSISSDGPVYSVVVAHRGNISEVEEIELDPASETSANLLRCLLAEGRTPRSTGCQPVTPGSLPATSSQVHAFTAASRQTAEMAKPTAGAPQIHPRLLIGDQAIRFRHEHENEFSFWDLGEAWKQLVDLPFVYALWLVRPEVADASSIANKLRALCDANLRNIDILTAQQTDFPREFCHRYWSENIRFSFGEKGKAGLRTFADLCARHGLLPNREPVLRLV